MGKRKKTDAAVKLDDGEALYRDDGVFSLSSRGASLIFR